MKKLLVIIVLGFLILSGCIKQSPAGLDADLGEYGKFIKIQTIKEFNIIYPNVVLQSVTPKSIVVWSRKEWVSTQEIANLAQYHCQKINLDAILLPSSKKAEDNSRTNNFMCQ